MPQSTEIQNDLRTAKMHAWLDKNLVAVALVAGVMGGCAIGASAMSLADRSERIKTAKRHDDEIRDFRMACRRTVDDRDGKVLEATSAAERATKAAAAAAEAAAQAADDAKPGAAQTATPPKARAPRTPPPDINAAVREANRRIAEDARK